MCEINMFVPSLTDTRVSVQIGPPSNARGAQGQLWYDAQGNRLYVHNGRNWVVPGSLGIKADCGCPSPGHTHTHNGDPTSDTAGLPDDPAAYRPQIP